MKYLVYLIVATFAGLARAESVDIKDLNTQGAEDESTTTISIKKGKPGTTGTGNQWEVTDGTADVEGEAGATQKDAKANWKKQCDEWKKEIRTENKSNGNIVLATNCGSMTCSGDAGQKICTSKASFKIKTKVN